MIHYVDMDNTLLYSTFTEEGLPHRVFVRAGAQKFIERLDRRGPVVLLTLARRDYALWAISHLGPSSRIFSNMIFWEDLEPIENELIRLVDDYPLGGPKFDRAVDRIRPIAPAGVVFDDAPVGNGRFWVKTVAVGVGSDHYVEVPPFDEGKPDAGGLERAWKEYQSRFSKGVALAGRRVI